MMTKAHQYCDRRTGRAVDERFHGDPLVSFLYSRVRERPQWLYRALTSARLTDLVAALEFDRRPRDPARMRQRLAQSLKIDYGECLDDPATLDTPRKSFERRIRYWACRPMAIETSVIASPADARVVTGSLCADSALYLKDKFFDVHELVGPNWARIFKAADYAVFRLTPDKYHYNHVPASGRVLDMFTMDGRFQSCHPAVVVAHGTPISKNRRTVTVLDTDVPGGSQVGLVAMVEVVALMIGDIVQCYSKYRYDDPQPVQPGMWLERGQPKSVFRPGSSTVVLLFQPNRVAFAADLLTLRGQSAVQSRYELGWGQPLVEVDVAVRSHIGDSIRAVPQDDVREECGLVGATL